MNVLFIVLLQYLILFFRHIQSAIERASKERTSLIVAHRLSTIVRAEQIVVMDQVARPSLNSLTKAAKLLLII